jgi:hypothetical protein
MATEKHQTISEDLGSLNVEQRKLFYDYHYI